MKRQTSTYHHVLIANLSHPEEAEAYLQAVKEEYPDGYGKALRNVEQALSLVAPASTSTDKSTG